MKEEIKTKIGQDPNSGVLYIIDAYSEDDMYYWSLNIQDKIGISCAKSELRDNTRGHAGYHFINPRYPGSEVSDELVSGARQFSEAVKVAREELRQEQKEELDND